ncbi:Nitrilase/cyanide hydratase and apolipo protein N-acyltransferase [Gilbertella persicaria]|uniref:Nitrilase/cyanide hydratase and apolipo protein N-acyltransferase n=1 Tax=Gilbertella persicaria TaxID=101096 RepID=UPI00221EDB3C|nr:Nitrilase/cyanide hydratase and apolipo protein N-acyltransferase [Gilbertella persicaria]KAI8090988.1 Nitrilase/cyanide hydratase and apolipo protein N-acyltransferase [Gilbertella persicaria]
MRIAAVQLHIDHQDKEVNWKRAEEFMAQAVTQQVDLIVFPEYFIGGPGKHRVEKTAPGVAVQRFCQLAKKYKMDIVPGTLIERDPQDGHVYNTAYYIDQSGHILLAYRKMHLWHPERSYLKEGKEGYATVTNRFGIRVGLCICWDIVFPDVFKEMALKQKAQLIIAPAYWSLDDGGALAIAQDPLSEANMLNAISTARCFENGIVFVLCNPAHESNVTREQPFGTMAGRTQITVPFKGPVAHCDHEKEAMIVADVDIDGLTKDAEEVYKVRKDWDQGYLFYSKL